MIKRALSRRGGFTLIELLIVIAIIGLLAAMIIPNMIDAMQKAKQKRTMAEERLAGTAFMAWLTDNCGSAAAGANAIFSLERYTLVTQNDIAAAFVPQYIQRIPDRDGWGNSFEYRFNECEDGEHFVAIRSSGADGIPDGSLYSSGGYPSIQFDRDIVWADGFFISWPTGVETAVAP